MCSFHFDYILRIRKCLTLYNPVARMKRHRSCLGRIVRPFILIATRSRLENIVRATAGSRGSYHVCLKAVINQYGFGRFVRLLHRFNLLPSSCRNLPPPLHAHVGKLQDSHGPVLHHTHAGSHKRGRPLQTRNQHIRSETDMSSQLH